jgi:hypothetical protein
MLTQYEMKRQCTIYAESILHVGTQFGIKIVYCYHIVYSILLYRALLEEQDT